MKKTVLYSLWGFFYLLCGLAANATTPNTAQTVALVLLGLLFFLPPVLLLVDALRKPDRKTLFILRLLSILSLSLTLGALVANIAVVNASDAVGNILFQVLIWVSVPMVCSQYYVLSLFLWGCLLFATLPGFILKKK